MNIVFISDANYAYSTGLAIRSLLRCCQPKAVYVLSAGMALDQEQEILSLGTCIQIVAIPEWANTWLSLFRTHGDAHVSLTTYAKLLLHRILPDLDRVLYLDGDVITLRDPSPLHDIEMGSALIGATCNVLAMQSERTRLSLPDPYFNAGVLVCPLDKWRAIDAETLFHEWYLKNVARMRYDDQDIFNGVFCGKVQWIDKRWNISHFEVLAARKLVKFDLSECGIIHFNGPHKPWNDDYHLRWGIDDHGVASAKKMLADINSPLHAGPPRMTTT